MRGFRRALRFMYSYPLRYRRSMLLTQSLVLVALLLAITIPLVVRQAIDIGIFSNNPTILLGSAVVVLLIGGTSVAMLYAAKRIRFGVAGRAVNDLRRDTFRHLLRLDATSVTEAAGGQALTRLTADATAVRGVANGGLFEVANQVVIASVTFAVCLWLDWRVTLLAVLPLVPVTVGTMRVQLKLQKVFADIRGHVTSLLSGVMESLSNVAAIKSFGREAHSSAQLSGINETLAQRRTTMRMTYGVYNAFFNVIGSLAVPIAVWQGATAVLDGRISVGGVVALIALIMMLQMNVHMIIMDFNGTFRTVVFGDRLLRLFDAAPALTPTPAIVAPPALAGRVTAHDLRLTVQGRDLFAGVDLDIEPGQFVAIVGPTGSGKSALLHVLARLRDATSGNVRYDDLDAATLDYEAMRQQVICLPQRQWIFEGDLEQNIAFVRPGATTQEVAEAATRAGIGHLGLDRRLAAGAPDLSAGERQRVGLARALLVDPPILLLDNPTANLDAETEARFLDNLSALRTNRTIIIATQHTVVARRADRTFVLHDRRLSEAIAGEHTREAAAFLSDLQLVTTAAAPTGGQG